MSKSLSGVGVGQSPLAVDAGALAFVFALPVHMTDMLACIALLYLHDTFYEHRPCAILLCIIYDLLRIILIPLDRARLFYGFTSVTCFYYLHGLFRFSYGFS